MKLTQEQYDELRKQGMSDEQIKTTAQRKGYQLPNQGGVITGVLKGAAKGFVGDIARPTAQLMQGLGQGVLAAVDPTRNLQQIREKTGIKSLDDTTPEGQSVVQSLKTEGGSELAGRIGVNVASFFVPTAPLAGVAGRGMQTAGKVTTRVGIGISAKEAPLVQAYRAGSSVPERIMAALSGNKIKGAPVLNSETALKHGLWGTESMIGVQAKKAATNIWQDVISPTLKGSQEKVNMPRFMQELGGEINKVADPTRKKQLTEALASLSDDFKGIGDVSFEDLQKFKEGWATFIPDKVYRGKPIASGFREIQNMAASMARNKIYSLLPDDAMRAAYIDYGNLVNLQKLGQSALSKTKFKGGTGSLLSGLYSLTITPIATTGGLTLYRAGKGLEFVGAAGARMLGHLFR